MHRAIRSGVVLGVVLTCGCPTTTHVVGSSTAAGDGVTGQDSGTGDSGGDGDVVEDHRTYFIGESLAFDGGVECENKDLNTVTSALREELDAAGWTGMRLVDDDTWPEDFGEATLFDGGRDDVYADVVRLAIFAGHGGAGLLQWGTPSDAGLCRLTIDSSMRLGRLAGDHAAAVMLLTSCIMRKDIAWDTFQDQGTRQLFGYHDSPGIGSDEARKVFMRSADGQPSADAWLEEMVQNAAGKHSPAVLTLGTSPDDASDTHGLTNLASGVGLLENVGEPVSNYHYELYDSGCDTICGNCGANNAPLPELMLSAPVSTLTLIRPQRSAAELVERASVVLEAFELAPLEPAALARLEAWAAQTVERGDVSYAQILDEPRVDLSYDPDSDQLRITDRGALARARPAPGELVDDSAVLEESLVAEAEAEGTRAALGGLLDASVLLSSTPALITRSLADGSDADPQPEPVAFEYFYTWTGERDGLTLPDYEIGVGVTRLGELASVTLSLVEVEPGASLGYQRSPEQALDALREAVLATPGPSMSTSSPLGSATSSPRTKPRHCSSQA